MKLPSKYYFDKKAAKRAVDWIEKYTTHVKGELATKPIILEDWQKKDIVEPIFGTKDKLTGLRRYSTVYIEIPRKNAKSTLGAAIGLLLLMADGELGAEIYSAAASRKQAGIVFDVAKRMVTNKKALSSRAKNYRNSVTYEKTGSFYQAIASDADKSHGFNAHGIIFDELHTQPNRELYDVLTTSVGSRRQPLTLLLTTAGIFDTTSICWEMHEYARKVNEGIIEDESFLGIIYTAPPKMDIFNIDTWRLANPGFGSIVKQKYLEREALKVKNNPNYENTFRRLHLNQWTSSLSSWIADDVWMKCNKKPINLADYEGFDIALGLDLASTDDTTSLGGVILENNKPIAFVLWVWVPEEMVQIRLQRGFTHYKNWIDQGLMYQTPGNVTDYRIIEKKVVEINDKMNIVSFGFDKWNSSQMIINLAEQIDEEKLDKVEMNIGTLSEPTKDFYKLIKTETVNHGGQPVLRWMVSNVMIYEDTNENIRPSKKSSSDKIDGPMSIIVAIAAWASGNETDDINETFATRGFTTT